MSVAKPISDFPRANPLSRRDKSWRDRDNDAGGGEGTCV
jgi:hypothetical protein